MLRKHRNFPLYHNLKAVFWDSSQEDYEPFAGTDYPWVDVDEHATPSRLTKIVDFPTVPVDRTLPTEVELRDTRASLTEEEVHEQKRIVEADIKRLEGGTILGEAASKVVTRVTHVAELSVPDMLRYMFCHADSPRYLQGMDKALLSIFQMIHYNSLMNTGGFVDPRVYPTVPEKYRLLLLSIQSIRRSDKEIPLSKIPMWPEEVLFLPQTFNQPSGGFTGGLLFAPFFDIYYTKLLTHTQEDMVFLAHEMCIVSDDALPAYNTLHKFLEDKNVDMDMNRTLAHPSFMFFRGATTPKPRRRGVANSRTRRHTSRTHSRVPSRRGRSRTRPVGTRRKSGKTVSSTPRRRAAPRRRSSCGDRRTTRRGTASRASRSI
jgi:hypothetical protein